LIVWAGFSETRSVGIQTTAKFQCPEGPTGALQMNAICVDNHCGDSGNCDFVVPVTPIAVAVRKLPTTLNRPAVFGWY
jgi:hypothetical protein